MDKQNANLRMVAWEVTRSCNLSCAHCRASSKHGPYPGELSKEECFKVLDEIVSFAKPVIILTGGEPLLREDIFEIAAYGKKCGLVMVMAPNGLLLTDENIKKIIASGIKRISVSLDGPNAKIHDNLRQVPGAFDGAIAGIKRAKKLGLEFQINSTITKRNIQYLPEMMKLAKDLGAAAHHIFLLVPTGRGKDMEKEELSPLEYEETLKFLEKEKNNFPLQIKVTCAPHYNRILAQNNPQTAGSLRGRGCMGGVSFCFISHVGELSPCGYLELKCGNVRKEGFKKAWLESEVFNNLRDFSRFKGKCGVCEFRYVCAGCRARAYAKCGDYLSDEPYCIYQPAVAKEQSET
ncbi:MAG: radical SAM/SPASM domain-containing protein [Candidatus Omnitrophica bacterium CG11_big_fil_rev_8_21_14_0_20_42_13]|uniref:Radical SAM/SPASM domain-containing protein n=1 Tax=Candidatus Ghiorseimicrobium undicola TaxID=1974746 RepID=A0A2H0M0X1_9BACT|nr:MAG: radical SAM/SPASM domain-containing protein [Candidatus Omnitrophica bacterium CG11_big_fil_rev_8_21_14_0_20_42_13]